MGRDFSKRRKHPVLAAMVLAVMVPMLFSGENAWASDPTVGSKAPGAVSVAGTTGKVTGGSTINTAGNPTGNPIKGNLNGMTQGKAGNAQPPMPPIVKVNLLTPALKADIRSSPKEYKTELPIKLQVVSTVASWQLTAAAIDLKLDAKHSIASEDIGLSLPGSRTVRLDKKQLVFAKGVPGVTELEFPVSLFVDQVQYPGTYKGYITLVAASHLAKEPACVQIPFEVTVTCHVENTITGNKIYFHVGNPFQNPLMTANVTGRLRADAPVCLTVSTEKGRLDQLPLQKAFFSRVSAKTPPAIPFSVKLGEGGAESRGPDFKKAPGEAAWLVKGTPGQVDYRLECTIRPEAYQAPGDYGTSAVLTVVPVL